MKYFIHLILITGLIIIMTGCDEAVEEPELAPRVLQVSIAEGGEIASNAVITVTFNKEMDAESVVISLNGIPVSATSEDGMVFEFIPGIEGEFELNITGEDISGQVMDPSYTPIRITITAPDVTPPGIVDAECRPKNGEEWIDPAEYQEEITIVFDEPMSETVVIATDPEFPFSQELSADGRSLAIKFEKYTLANETEYIIKLSGVDLAGNPLRRNEYSFTTLPMEGMTPSPPPILISMNEEIALVPFQEITFEFELDIQDKRRFNGSGVILDVSGSGEVQIAINDHDIGKIPGHQDNLWHTEFIEFMKPQEDILNLNGDNVLTIGTNEDAVKIRDIRIDSLFVPL